MKGIIRSLLILILAAVQTGCAPGSDLAEYYQQIEGKIFGTHYRITYLGGPAPETVQATVKRRLERIDWIASTWKAESELMRYNRAPDRSAFQRSPELEALMELSEHIRVWTGGAFDIDYDKDGKADLSAMAKGYAVDQICDLLITEFDLQSCLVEIGGEIKVHGPGPKGADWTVEVFLPRRAKSTLIETPRLRLRDTSIATSGPTFKGHHLIDPDTGEAARPHLLSASVIHHSNATADALATALYVMGPEKGMAWASDNRIHVLFILEDGSILEHQPE